MTFDQSQESYVALRGIIAERTNGVVFWIGSGPSSEAGLPGWSGLKDELLKALEAKVGNLDDPKGGDLRKAVRNVRTEQDNWRAFERLRSALGRATWRSRIRELLGPSASIETPPVYRKIWDLRPHGILTLNLDRLATKAYTETYPGGNLAEFAGKQAADYTHVLRSPHSFICHLHGNLDDASSWIMTASDLDRQKKSQAYTNFITSCLSAKTVVFIGISADDRSVGGFIQQLSDLQIDIGSHYWVTDRRDMATDTWAEEQGIRLIRYDASDGSHSELSAMLDDLIAFVSKDDPQEAVPVSPRGFDPEIRPLPSKADLLQLDEEEIRQCLNAEASRILQQVTPETTEEYDRFSEDYDQAIYRAWYTSTESGSNRLLGSTLHREMASGAFGKVYQAHDSEGQDVAVKVLHEGIRRNPDLLQAFRRGVRSMQILGRNDVEGMVPYKKAFEIPACVTMDWIEGPNLHQAVSAKQITDWETILRIGSDIADIVRRGHALPERVLHRDIRPSNVMLRRFHSDPDEWDVVVLDFDLSWHRGALERSVVHGSTTFGYLAPEQIQDIQGVSTRHAAVDSFGMGMVLFFMMTGRDPIPDEHKHLDWKNSLKEASGEHPCSQWQSTPSRFARLIDYATQDKQADRWDMTQIQAELKRLHEAVLYPKSTQSIELIAEEIAVRCEFNEGYEWDGNTLSAVRESASGVRCEIQADESQREVRAKLEWGKPGVQGKAHLDKYIPNRMENARQILESFGWRIEHSQTRYAHISISASLPAERSLRSMNETAKSLDRALDQLRF